MIPLAAPDIEDSLSGLKLEERGNRLLDQSLHGPSLRRLIPGFIKPCGFGIEDQAHAARLPMVSRKRRMHE
jgi:hypothetical protein